MIGVLLTYLAINYTTVLHAGRGGTYVEAVVGSPRYFNPLLSGYQSVDQTIASLLFSGLTRMSERGDVEPDLARDWDVSADGLSYTFYLRSNATWHDGRPVRAEDVAFTVHLLQDPDFPGQPSPDASPWSDVRVEIVNPLTVRFHLPEPYSPFIDSTATGLVPSHMLKGTRVADLPVSDFNLNPVGTGPFEVEAFDVEDERITSLTLSQAPRQYRAKRPYLNRIQFRFYPDFDAALAAYERGDVEGISEIPPDQLAGIHAEADLDLFSAPMGQQAMVLLNHGNPELAFFEDLDVRQAMAYALDRQQIIDQVLQGQAIVAHSPLLPGTWAYTGEVTRYYYSPDKASRLLDGAGWYLQAYPERIRRRRGKDLEFTLLAPDEPDLAMVARSVAEQWQRVGISVTTEISPSASVRRALERHDFEAALISLSSPGDPDPYPFWHETQFDIGQNFGSLAHRKISETIEQARVVGNRERRTELYHEFQRVFTQDLPALPLYVPVYTYAVDRRINDVQVGPLTSPADRFRSLADWWIVPRRILVGAAMVGQP